MTPEYAKPERRLDLLRLIVQEGGRSNDGSLLTAMRELGHRQFLDQSALRELMRDCAARDCLTVAMLRDTVMIGDITERGRMAVRGDILIDGIASPHNGL
jgi:hypothetical protein